ncbi:MAG: hypothetical protein LBB65_01990, partial [Burkholderiales bacterium]|nr:hypothetical protein [Burkholderiales bacterium]
MKAIDPKALKILMSYDLLAPENMSKEDFSYARKKGLVFDSCRMDHDEVVKWAVNEFAASRKSEVVRSFLIGIGLNEAYTRNWPISPLNLIGFARSSNIQVS